MTERQLGQLIRAQDQLAAALAPLAASVASLARTYGAAFGGLTHYRDFGNDTNWRLMRRLRIRPNAREETDE
jgi:hypothetical protein